MKFIILLSALLSGICNCAPHKFRHYEGYIFQSNTPLANVAVFEQDDPSNKTYTNKDGFFKLEKRPDAISRFLMVSKDNVIIDSIQVIRSSGGEQINYYFIEGRKDTLFVKKTAVAMEDQKDISLDQYIENINYFIKTFDVNKDGIDDKIVSLNRYLGDELLIFIGNEKNHYHFALKSTNFSEDGGNQIVDIHETKEGYEIITQFPDKGHFQKNYMVSGINNNFILKKVETESYSWQEGYTEICVQNINLNLNQSTEELLNTMAHAKKDCTKRYESRQK